MSFSNLPKSFHCADDANGYYKKYNNHDDDDDDDSAFEISPSSRKRLQKLNIKKYNNGDDTNNRHNVKESKMNHNAVATSATNTVSISISKNASSHNKSRYNKYTTNIRSHQTKRIRNEDKSNYSEFDFGDDLTHTKTSSHTKQQQQQPQPKSTTSTKSPISLLSSSSSSSSVVWKVPSDLMSPTQLKWHCHNDALSSTTTYLPCRIVPKVKLPTSSRQMDSDSDEYSGDDNDDDDDDDDDDEEVEIEYLSNMLYPQQPKQNKKSHSKKTKITSTTTTMVSKKRLIPYYGKYIIYQDMDYNDIASSQWSLDLYRLYQKSCPCDGSSSSSGISNHCRIRTNRYSNIITSSSTRSSSSIHPTSTSILEFILQ